jgi:hypothetical protein
MKAKHMLFYFEIHCDCFYIYLTESSVTGITIIAFLLIMTLVGDILTPSVINLHEQNVQMTRRSFRSSIDCSLQSCGQFLFAITAALEKSCTVFGRLTLLYMIEQWEAEIQN